MNSSNFSSYKSGRKYRYIGGLAKRSPIRLQIPSTGHWNVAIDMQGLHGSTRASVRVIPGALPPIREAPLSSLPNPVRDDPAPVPEAGGEIYNVFISHASEDKESAVRELADALHAENLKVWYDEFTLRIGDSLRQKIDRGLASSRVGLAVLSPSFISKGWPNYELDGIVPRSVSGDEILLPIWHNITKVASFSWQMGLTREPTLSFRASRQSETSHQCRTPEVADPGPAHYSGCFGSLIGRSTVGITRYSLRVRSMSWDSLLRRSPCLKSRLTALPSGASIGIGCCVMAAPNQPMQRATADRPIR